MRKLLFITFTFLAIQSNAQVFNYGHQHLVYKNLIANGICFMKTGDSIFDASMVKSLEKYWTISEWSTVERYKRPPKETTAMFITTKTKTKKHVMDRKNQHVLVLQPAALYKKDKQVPFDQTLGYMYYNGFYELMDHDQEYLFNKYIIKALNEGLSMIKTKKLHNKNQLMNEQIANEINEKHKGLLGNTLIINREALVHFIVEKFLKKFNFTHRLHAKDEFYSSLKTTSRTHYMLYYSVNTKTELSLVNILTAEVIYTKQFEEGYTEISAKEMKLLAPFF